MQQTTNDFPKIELEHQLKFMKTLHDHAGSPEAKHMFAQVTDSLYELFYIKNKAKTK